MSETPTETINRLYTEKRQAERQRDELMAALKQIAETEAWTGEAKYLTVVNVAKSAIAKAEQTLNN